MVYDLTKRMNTGWFLKHETVQKVTDMAARSRKASWLQVGYVVNQIIMFKDDKSVELLCRPGHCGLES